MVAKVGRLVTEGVGQLIRVGEARRGVSEHRPRCLLTLAGAISRAAASISASSASRQGRS